MRLLGLRVAVQGLNRFFTIGHSQCNVALTNIFRGHIISLFLLCVNFIFSIITVLS
jgi:hypothetical protein